MEQVSFERWSSRTAPTVGASDLIVGDGGAAPQPRHGPAHTTLADLGIQRFAPGGVVYAPGWPRPVPNPDAAGSEKIPSRCRERDGGEDFTAHIEFNANSLIMKAARLRAGTSWVSTSDRACNGVRDHDAWRS
jgi:hypothetical protein